MPTTLTLNPSFDGVKGLMLALQFDTVDQAKVAFTALAALAALAAGGHVTMPLAPAFLAGIFRMLTDRLGVSWAVNSSPIDIR